MLGTLKSILELCLENWVRNSVSWLKSMTLQFSTENCPSSKFFMSLLWCPLFYMECSFLRSVEGCSLVVGQTAWYAKSLRYGKLLGLQKRFNSCHLHLVLGWKVMWKTMSSWGPGEVLPVCWLYRSRSSDLYSPMCWVYDGEHTCMSDRMVPMFETAEHLFVFILWFCSN